MCSMKQVYQEKKLNRLLMWLTEKEYVSESKTERWIAYIQGSGIQCILKGEETELRSVLQEYSSADTMILTDRREIAGQCSANGYVCIGLDPFMETFFDGAEAVAASIEDLDSIYIEETFLRAKGCPVLIAETERIRIREIRKEDIPALCDISRQEGMEYAFADAEQAEGFSYERMEAYISNVYRLYGYGLWTVETLEGEIIGCCGLADTNVNDNSIRETVDEACMVLYLSDSSESGLLLELQYFVANRFQKQGYGTEMCRAVIRYAKERLAEYEICVRIHRNNTVSVRLAEKLGFLCRNSCVNDTICI